MLEKIGLPAKPSLRGNNWVVDASHCQGCSSQFTFINRKHHCRRCGGLFCNSCTVQRMVLRGQGDAPVRSCEPCKQLEEAARFELRHGHRNRAVKAGSSRNVSKNKDELLAEILGHDAGISSSSGSEFITKAHSSTLTTASNSFSNQGDVNLDGMMSDNHVTDESEAGSASPEELRQRALDEKKKYRILKGERKPEEALKAFKRGKELERQADALELSLRKSRKKVSSVGNIVENREGNKESIRKNRPHGGKDKEKDDIVSELRELGWSEMDINTEDRKPASLEGELSALIGEIPQKPNISKGNLHIDKTQVLAHKKQALALKREGKLAEAKEELKKAKVLEKQLEEQELLAGAENSDDELSELIRNMDGENQDNYSHKREQNFDMEDLLGTASSIGVEGNFDVTDADMEDPAISAALKSLGWDEEPDKLEDVIGRPPPINGEVPVSKFPSKCDTLDVRSAENNSVLINESFASSTLNGERKKSKAEIQRELLGLKRKALSLRREGKTEEAEDVLKTAKTLEGLIAEMDAQRDVTLFSSSNPPSSKVDEENDGNITENDMQDPALLSMLKDLGWNDESEPLTVPKLPPKQIADGLLPTGPAMIQSSSRVSAGPPRSKAKIQRELLGLKRKALELRRKGEMEEAEEILQRAKVLEAEIEDLDAPKGPQIDVVGDHVGPHNVDDALKVNEVLHKEKSDQTGKSPCIKEEKSLASAIVNSGPIHLSADQGISTLKPAHQVSLMDIVTDDDQSNSIVSAGNSYVGNVGHNVPYLSFHLLDAESDMTGKEDVSARKCDDHAGKISQVNQTTSIQENVDLKSQKPVHQSILEHKKKAVDLKRQGKLAEAKEELKHAKLLERSLQEEESHTKSEVAEPHTKTEEIPSEREHDALKSSHKPLSSQERFKIQQESLRHKRQALKLRKEGKMKEADTEFDLAKALEAQLEDSHGSSKSSDGSADDVVVEDFLDPELLSALRAIGIGDANDVSRTPEKPEPVKPNVGRSDISSQERLHLEEQIKAEKIKAVNLKRSGKQAEALDALRQAKLLEKKLNSMAL